MCAAFEHSSLVSAPRHTTRSQSPTVTAHVRAFLSEQARWATLAQATLLARKAQRAWARARAAPAHVERNKKQGKPVATVSQAAKARACSTATGWVRSASNHGLSDKSAQKTAIAHLAWTAPLAATKTTARVEVATVRSVEVIATAREACAHWLRTGWIETIYSALFRTRSPSQVNVAVPIPLAASEHV